MKIRIIAGLYKGRFIKAPNTILTRPTSSKLRETFFNICQSDVGDASFLDVFAGSGAMGIEALSRGAISAVFIENNRAATACIKENLSSLSVEGKILSMDALNALDILLKKQERFDLIYCDPPYSCSLIFLEKILYKAQKLLSESGRLFLEFGQDLKGFSLIPKSLKKFSDSYLFEFS